MADKKVYSIVINGVQESTNAVESLNKQLSELENRIKTLEKNNVKINAGGSTTSGSNSSALKEEVAAQKEINQLKKEEAAQQRLIANEYANTMKGMKQNLADLKTVINTTDLGDDDSIKKMTSDANELTNKLKSMEQAYGQFGRNVGNYANGVAEGLQKVTVTVGGVERTFNNAREASRTLGNELKSMAINGQQGTKAFKDMQVAVAKLNSDIKDATVSSKAMDNLLDTMQSFAAIGSVTQGLSALFGFDNDEIQESIQKLVALQNVMQGIEKINQQINSQEGIGGWLAKGNSMIDSFVAKLTGAAKAQKELNAATTAGVTASKSLTTAQQAQTVATTTTTVATKALGVALKSIGIGLIISAIAALVEYWDDLKDILTDTVPALKNISTWFDKIKAVVVGVGTAILNYMVQPLATVAKAIQAIMNGNFSELPKIVAEGFRNTFNAIGNYQKGYNKEIERQQKAHNNKILKSQKEANDEWLKDEEAKYGKSYQATKKYLENQMQLITKQIANSKKGSKQYDELIKEQKDIQRKIWENERTEREKNAKKAQELTKKNAKEEAEAEKELAELKIANMKEGLNKELKQLEYEKNQKLAKVRANGVKVGELTLEIEKLYANKEKKLREDHAKEVEKIYAELWNNVYRVQVTAARMNLDSELNEINTQLDKNIEKLQEKLNSRYASYKIQYPSNMSKKMATGFEIWEMSYNKNDKKNVEEAKKYLDLLEQIEVAKAKAFAYNGRVIDSGADKKEVEKATKALEDWLNEIKKTQEEMDGLYLVQQLKNRSYTASLSNAYKIRIADIKKYYAQVEDLQKKHSEDVLKNDIQLLKDEYELERKSENARYEDEIKKLEENEKKLLEEGKDYLALRRAALDAHNMALKALSNKRISEEEKLEQDHNNRLKDIVQEGLNGRIQEYRDFYTAIGNLENRQPEKFGGILGDLGFINVGKTKKNYKEALDAYKNLIKTIHEEKDELQQQFDKHEISFNDFQQAKRELNDLEQACADSATQIANNLKDVTGQAISQVNQYIQLFGQSLQNLMQSIWDYQDYQFEKEQYELDKWNDELNEKLDEQQEIVQKHKDAIDSIEDELATARGSRREHLIDQLNAEMEAERAAQKEKQKIDKEKKRAEKKQEELDKKRRKEEYDRNVMQAFVNWHLAIMNGLATQPFLYMGIAMGALATVLGGVQYALIKSQKPYARGGQLDGGVAQGNRHRDGGIPVLGGRASIEGGEYITNRVTTSKNVELLDYINSKKKKIDITDLMDFYSTTPRKTIKGVRTKFEDGGYLPTLPNELDIKDQLQNIVVNQDNRPIYVSVVDINNKQEDVRRVQTLAGL